MPRHTRVPQRGVRGAAKFGVTAFLLMFYYIRCRQIVIYNKLGVPPIFFKGLKGAANQKRLKNTALEHRFLTGGPWTTKGSVERAKGVHEGHISKVFYTFKPLL